MRTRIALFLGLLGGSSLYGQARPTADRAGDLQIGGSFSIAQSDYAGKIRGIGFYTDFDFRSHYGVELNFHQLNNADSIVYERTYEVGGRYILRPRRFQAAHPYAKVMIGRGVFNFPPPYPPPYPQNLPAANLAYNLVALGGGADFEVHPRINVRADYEYQRWFSFPPNGLTPQLVTFGVAYHFPAGRPH